MSEVTRERKRELILSARSIAKTPVNERYEWWAELSEEEKGLISQVVRHEAAIWGALYPVILEEEE